MQVAPSLRQKPCLELRFEEITAAAKTYVAPRAANKVNNLKNCIIRAGVAAGVFVGSETVGHKARQLESCS